MPNILFKLSYIDRIKLLMLTAMTVGHFAWVFVVTESWLGQLMHFFARLTIPLACFLVVEGFLRTHHLDAYIKRMFGFALLAQLPYAAFVFGITQIYTEPKFIFFGLNVLFSLGFALLTLLCYHNIQTTQRHQQIWYAFSILLLLILSINSDWGYLPIIWTIAIYQWRVKGFIISTVLLFILSAITQPNNESSLILLDAYHLMDYGLFLAASVMYWYDHHHQKISHAYRLPRLLFYWYYALHLLVLSVFS